MKKYLMTEIAALAMCAGFTSCSHDLTPASQEEINAVQAKKVVDTYNQAFVAKFGQPAANQNWGFGSIQTNARAVTRSVSVSSLVADHPFDLLNESKSTIDGYYKTTTTTQGYTNDNDMQNVTEFKLTGRTEAYKLHLWGGSRDIFIEGNVTLDVVDDASSINQARIYVLPNATLTLNMSHYINDLEIYVHADATLNYNAPSLYKQTGGGKLFNRGIVNFGPTFAANTNAIVYNEGTMYGKVINSAPGDANPSKFYNLGSLYLRSGDGETNTAMYQCNAKAAHFYNGGMVDVDGLTDCTQADIWWINNGHWTTQTFEKDAWNQTYFNYCQLLVKGEAYLHDGDLNMMADSYAEFGTGRLNNFKFNMENNSGVNFKGSTNWYAEDQPGGQGAGIKQGFFATESATNCYVRLAGTTTIPKHNKALEISSGITYAINDFVITGVTDHEALKTNNDGDYPCYVFEGIEKPFSNVSVTPKTGSNECGATWTITDPNPEPDPEPEYAIRIIGEDLTPGETDWDFNDVVFAVDFNGSTANCTLLAAGGTLPLRIATKVDPSDEVASDWVEVHALFGVDTKVMVNTGGISTTVDRKPTFTCTGVNPSKQGSDIIIKVNKGTNENPNWIELKAEQGEPAAKLAVGKGFKMCIERQNINEIYERFKDWVGNPEIKWY